MIIILTREEKERMIEKALNNPKTKARFNRQMSFCAGELEKLGELSLLRELYVNMIFTYLRLHGKTE